MIDSFKQVSWANTASIYEVNIRQYTAEGTFKAFEKHLPRIKEMGIDIVWLMPITPISQVNKKGNLGSYYTIHPCALHSLMQWNIGSINLI